MHVGVIGVGNMGSGIAMNLLDRGHKVTVRDIKPEAEQRVAVHGAQIAPHPRGLAQAVEIVILVVVNAAQIESVLFGTDGVFSGYREGGSAKNANVPAVMICSTIAPEDTERFAKGLESFGAVLLDAPISGGPARARDGGMSLMLAASAEARTRFESLLHDMAARLLFVSNRVGDGARVKLLNNLLGGIQLIAGASALAAGERMGLSGETLFKVISASSGQSWVTDDRLPRALAGDFEPRAHAHILTKDVTLALEMLKNAGESFPLGDIALETFKAALDAGWRDKDDCVVLEVARGKAGGKPPRQ
jgi:3-hydroxyisobutyrate dehydrogenase